MVFDWWLQSAAGGSVVFDWWLRSAAGGSVVFDWWLRSAAGGSEVFDSGSCGQLQGVTGCLVTAVNCRE